MNSIEWSTITEWLELHGYISFDWEEITNEDCIYCADTNENIFISIFTNVAGELVVFIGCNKPYISTGENTGIYVQSEWDIIDYLKDNLEDMYDRLNIKIMEELSDEV